MGFQGIPQSHSSVIKSSLSRLGFKKRYIKLGRWSGRLTANVPSGEKIWTVPFGENPTQIESGLGLG